MGQGTPLPAAVYDCPLGERAGAAPRQVDDGIRAIELAGTRLDGAAIPANDPGHSFAPPAEEDDLMPLREERASEHVPNLSSAPGISIFIESSRGLLSNGALYRRSRINNPRCSMSGGFALPPLPL